MHHKYFPSINIQVGVCLCVPHRSPSSPLSFWECQEADTRPVLGAVVVSLYRPSSPAEYTHRQIHSVLLPFLRTLAHLSSQQDEQLYMGTLPILHVLV